MNEIFVNQNSEENLQLLVIQRGLNTEAKRLTSFQFVLCLVFPVFVAIFNANSAISWLKWAVPLAIIVVYVIGLFLQEMIQSRKILAARFSQAIDMSLFHLKGDEVIYLANPLPNENDLKKWRTHFEKKTPKKMEKWYSDNSTLPHYQAVFDCQKENFYWSEQLTQNYSVVPLLSFFLFLLAAIIYGCISNYALSDFLVLGVGLLPLTRHYISLILFLNREKKWFEKMGEKIRSLDKEKTSKTAEEMEKECERIQFQLFTYRCSNLFIPDWFYHLNKSKINRQNGNK